MIYQLFTIWYHSSILSDSLKWWKELKHYLIHSLNRFKLCRFLKLLEWLQSCLRLSPFLMTNLWVIQGPITPDFTISYSRNFPLRQLAQFQMWQLKSPQYRFISSGSELMKNRWPFRVILNFSGVSPCKGPIFGKFTQNLINHGFVWISNFT